MELQKFIDVIELFAADSEELKDLIVRLLHHGSIECGVFDKDIMLHLVLNSLSSLNGSDFSFHYNK